MRKLITTTFVTLDGVMQAPGGPGEDEDAGFQYGGWSVPYWDETMDQAMTEIMGKPFDLLLGRKTYDIFAAYWPTSTEPGAEALNRAHKYVASRSLDHAGWANTSLLKGDVAGEIRNLKQGDGPELQVHGSGSLIQTLLKNNLIDEMHIHIFPVVVGKGKRLFADGTVPEGLKLTKSSISKTGVIVTTYLPAGDLKTGTFG